MSTFLSILNLSKTFGFHKILNQVSLSLGDGQRVGLVGANGVGKSTLLKIIIRELDADSGSVQLSPGAQLGYLAQVITGVDDQTIDDLLTEPLQVVYQLETRMRQLEQQMTLVTAGRLDSVMADYGEAVQQFEQLGGYDLEYRIDQIAAGLRIDHLPRSRKIGTLSGGEQTRVGLARLLLQSPDVLLLDEPTNHLDSASLTWLEDYLQTYQGAILMVSHDREFLNRTVNAIIEIDEHTRAAKRYTGNYDTYHQAKLLERRKWVEDFQRQQDEIKALRLEMKETAHRNNNYRAHKDNDQFVLGSKKETHASTVARRIRVAEEKLKRIEDNPIPRPPNDLSFDPDFDPQALKGRLPMIVSGVSKAYDGRCILHDVSFELDLKSRVVLVGENGAGKSTLLRMLVGQEAPDTGDISVNPGAHVGYLDQQNNALDRAKTLFEAYSEGMDESEQRLKSLILGMNLFRYDDLGKRVGELSSGQYRKLQLARLMVGKANLLILDEPTNYVSFDVLEGLETALREFPGPVLAASHDRRFIQQFGGEVWEVRDGRVVK